MIPFMDSPLLCLLLGLTLGGGLGYLLARSRTALSALAQAEVNLSLNATSEEMAQRQHQIESLLAPMRSALDRVQAELSQSERERLRAAAALDEHLSAMRLSSEGLRSETGQLVNALRAPQIRGRWGELQLERAIEAAGMVEHVDYRTQVSSPGPDGVVRPDMVVTLVGGRHIVIDAKVAFAGYLEAMEAADPAKRADRLRAHARQLRNHVDSLSEKAYWEAFDPSPEFVVCFVPADAFLDAALRVEPGLLEHGFARNVVIATPSTLVALLRTIAYTWRQESLAKNTAEVSKLGRELYQRLAGLDGHLEKLGRALAGSVAAFNASIGTLEGRVLVSARRLADLSVVDTHADGTLAPPEQILTTTRSVGSVPEVGRVT
jgi:DNA recombination protein RmuC